MFVCTADIEGTFFLSMSSFCSFSWHCYCYRMVNKSTEWVSSTEKYFLQLILLFMRKVSYSFHFGGCVATIEILLIIYEVKSHKPHHNFSIFLSFLMQNNFIFIYLSSYKFFNKLAFCELFKFLIFFLLKRSIKINGNNLMGFYGNQTVKWFKFIQTAMWTLRTACIKSNHSWKDQCHKR